jgi:hypothetical protein
VRFKEVAPDRKEDAAPEGGSESIDKPFECGYPQTEWVREKARKRAPPEPISHRFSTAVDYGVDA